MTTEFAKQVHEYVIHDRQWPRHLRIAYAKSKMAEYTLKSNYLSPEYQSAVNFWRAVLKRNED